MGYYYEGLTFFLSLIYLTLVCGAGYGFGDYFFVYGILTYELMVTSFFPSIFN